MVKTISLSLLLLFIQGGSMIEPERLPVSAFTHIPKIVRTQLAKQGCRIPQAWGEKRIHNIVSGEFARKGQTDWAALCSVGGRSHVVVLWGGNASCAPIKEELEDASGFQDVDGKGTMGFSIKIGVASPTFILDHRAKYRESHSAIIIAHDGIDFGFVEKGSRIEYCDKGKWHRFPGSD
jgi:hypothetical protein